MLDLGSWGEFLIIALAALLLIGPKEMPTVLKAIGRWTYKGKKVLHQFRQTYDVYLQEGEIQEYIKETNKEVMKTESQNESSQSENQDDGPMVRSSPERAPKPIPPNKETDPDD